MLSFCAMASIRVSMYIFTNWICYTHTITWCIYGLLCVCFSLDFYNWYKASTVYALCVLFFFSSFFSPTLFTLRCLASHFSAISRSFFILIEFHYKQKTGLFLLSFLVAIIQESNLLFVSSCIRFTVCLFVISIEFCMVSFFALLSSHTVYFSLIGSDPMNSSI